MRATMTARAPRVHHRKGPELSTRALSIEPAESVADGHFCLCKLRGLERLGGSGQRKRRLDFERIPASGAGS